MGLALRYAPDVQDFVRGLAPGPKKALRHAVDLIKQDPRHRDLDLKQLRKQASVPFFRARVQRDYRIIYSIHANHVHLWRIMHRSEGYAWLDRLDPWDAA